MSNTETEDMRSLSEVDKIFSLQTKNRWNASHSTAKDRIRKIQELQKKITAHTSQLHEAMWKDFRKPEQEVDLTEIMPVIHEIKVFRKNLKRWMRPVNVPTPPLLIGGKSQIIYEPKGLTLIIGPWNYPFMLVMAPLISAIATGNCVIIKPSEYTPNTNSVVKKIISSIFSENEVAMIEGSVSTSTHLLAKPFDHIFFTGSTSVGKKIMEAAAKNLTSVTLELGGKSPVIIDETVKLNSETSKIIWGKLLNGGQTCVGVDYVLVHESKHDEFIVEAKKNIQKFYGEKESDWKTTPDFCRIINEKNFNRLKAAFDETVKSGAKVETGGVFEESELYISPSVLSGVSLNSAIMKEEIFGPILPVIKYKNIEDVLKIINDREKPLALYIFSTHKKTIKHILSNTSSGGVVINGVIVHLSNPNLPFGGVNHSGIGSYHGYFGFKSFSHERAVFKMPGFSLLKKLFPPYTKISKKLIDVSTKYL